MLLWFAITLPVAALAQGDANEFFEERVAPIFERACISCHGPERSKGDLDLSSYATAMAGGADGVALVPGRPEESRLFDMVSGDAPEMPRKGDPLPAEEVEVLRRWIAEGARWPEGRVLRAAAARKAPSADWWSLRPIVRPVVPESISSWVRTPVDAFVLRRLQEAGLEPSAEADRRTLIRRLTYDLHGLPPTPDEVDAFVGDPSPDAYEHLVDRMLDSPRYGERWGRHWLDVVHFGETHGFDKDKLRPNAWPYRDYVIESLNQDKPYARFVTEQIAGDVLSPDDPAGVVATGFVAAGPWDYVGHVELREGTVDKEITRSLDRDDMVTTALSTFASTTVHCARCHDHKFDPIPQQDYYRLQAVFAGVERADRAYELDAGVRLARLRLETELGLLVSRSAEIEERIAAVSSPEIRRIDDALDRNAELLVATPPFLADAPDSGTLGYHSAIAATPAAEKWVQVDLGRTLELNAVVLLPAHVAFGGHPGPGFGFPPRFRVDVSDRPDFEERRTLADHTRADFPSPGDEPVVIEAKGTKARFVRVTATSLWERTGDWIFALSELLVFRDEENVALGAETRALDSIEDFGWGRANLTDGATSLFRLDDAPPLAEWIATRKKRAALEQECALLEEARRLALEAAVGSELSAERAALAAQRLALETELAALPAQARVYAVATNFPPEGNFTPSAEGPRPVYLLPRGDVRSPGPEMPPGALTCLPALAHHFDLRDGASEGERRVVLANWLTDPANPLTWRSIVNRVWHYHFGRGLADSPNDFGRMGLPPTHPELLDWLAGWFRDGGGSLKDLHRLLVTSAVYRQASSGRPDAARIDAQNSLLWRMSSRRLEAEAVRDSALAASGRLDLTMGGPSDRHFAFEDDHSPRYDYRGFDQEGAASERRSIYRFLVRSVPDPFFECLDCADPSLLTPKRSTTLTALQALAMLNNPFMVSCAEALAADVAARHADVPRQTEKVWRRVLSRRPTPEESILLEEHVGRHGLASLCRLAFNLNEFHFVD